MIRTGSGRAPATAPMGGGGGPAFVRRCHAAALTVWVSVPEDGRKPVSPV